MEQLRHHYEQNIRVYTAYRFFWGLMIIGPVITPYLILKGMTYAEIMLLQSVMAISIAVFEIPTGALADKLSRKTSLCLSTTCFCLAMCTYVLAQSFAVLAVAEVIFGLGVTFGSGADSAILHESLARLGRQDEYPRIEGRAAAWVFAGQGVGSVVSSLIYTYDPNLPFIVGAVNMGIASLITLRFFEPLRAKNEDRYHTHILQSLRRVFGTRSLIWALLLAVVMGFSFRTAFWLYEPYFKAVGIHVAWFGTVFFFYNVVAALSARWLTGRHRDHRTVLLSLGLILSTSYVLPGLFVHQWALVLIGLQQLVRGTYRPTLSAYINTHVDDRYRATAISTVSLAANLSFAVFSPIIGLLLDRQGAVPAYLWMGAFTFTGILLLGLVSSRRWVAVESANR